MKLEKQMYMPLLPDYNPFQLSKLPTDSIDAYQLQEIKPNLLDNITPTNTNKNDGIPVIADHDPHCA